MLKYKKLSMLVASALLFGCNSSNSDDINPPENDDSTPFKIGVITDTQGSTDGLAYEQLRAIFQYYQENDIKYVISVGDMTDGHRDEEYETYIEAIKDFPDIQVLPLAGNHDVGFVDNYVWKRFAQQLLPEGGRTATHMPTREYQTYTYTIDNVLMIVVSDGDLPIAYDFVKEQIENRDESIDHVIFSTHSPFAGPYRGGHAYGDVIARWSGDESLMIEKDFENWKALFTNHNVIYISGHDHQYSRSVIWSNRATPESNLVDPSSRFFHHVVVGNASDKSYYFRVGEMEAMQDMVMFRTKTATASLPSDKRDWTIDELARESEDPGEVQMNASWFIVEGDTISYEAFYDDYSSLSEIEQGGDWKLFDRFTVGANRCEKVIAPNSVPRQAVKDNMYDDTYRTIWCYSDEGTKARIIDGTNYLFNRVDQALNGVDWLSFGLNENDVGLVDRLFKYGKQGGEYRYDTEGSDSDFHARVDKEFGHGHFKPVEHLPNDTTHDGEIYWHPHTVDMKKLLQLSWNKREKETLSEVLIVSGIQGQTGVYSNPFGIMLDITKDEGRRGTAVDESITDRDVQNSIRKPALTYAHLIDDKSPNRMLEARDMELDSDLRFGSVRADDYVIEFTLPEGLNEADVIIAHDNGDGWQPLISDVECIILEPYSNALSSDCDSDAHVGFYNGSFWAKVDFEGRFAIIAR
ncbi:metallophosphoesterase [Vibrio sp. FNV 38]|nr:metallophosphoesterase [Vibrio sp. FNV 38]